MICIKADIPQEICDIDDELKAIYHSYSCQLWWIKGNPSKFPDRQSLVTVTLIQRQDSN